MWPHARQALLQAGGNALDGHADRFIRLGRIDAVVHQRPPDAQCIERPGELGMLSGFALKAIKGISLALEVKLLTENCGVRNETEK